MFLNKAARFIHLFGQIFQKIDNIQKALARIEKRQLFDSLPTTLSDYEFKVSSQWGEDGIIQFLINQIKITNRIFIEFGVADYTESNTRFLLQNDNWAGFIIDGSLTNINKIRNDPIYWHYNLKAEYAFIDRDNINQIISNNGIGGDIGLLSIDIDGNDYWVWEAIDCINPRIVICEYNSIFGPFAKVTIPYKERFQRSSAHYSNLYYGVSISALAALANKKGYLLVGSNRAGNNAFFVRNDLIGNIKISTPEGAYVKSQFRESRDNKGNPTFLDFEERFELIKDMEVYDIETHTSMKIKDITR